LKESSRKTLPNDYSKAFGPKLMMFLTAGTFQEKTIAKRQTARVNQEIICKILPGAALRIAN